MEMLRLCCTSTSLANARLINDSWAAGACIDMELPTDD